MNCKCPILEASNYTRISVLSFLGSRPAIHQRVKDGDRQTDRQAEREREGGRESGEVTHNSRSACECHALTYESIASS